MNDRAEQAFRDAFAEHADEYIEPVRPRRRFDSRWAVAAAVALVVLAVPITLFLQGRGGTEVEPVVASPATGGPDQATSLSGLADAKEGWKWVSRGDVAVQVPESWPYSGYSWTPWCLNGAVEPTMPEGPFVEAPPGAIPAIACSPAGPEFVRMHLGFGAPSEGGQSGATEVLEHRVGANGVHVVLEASPSDDDRALAEEILSTATTFERDAAGCAPVGPITSVDDRPEPWDIPNSSGMQSVGICRYLDGTEPGAPNLVGSRLLTDVDEVTSLLDGIASAPEGVSGNPADCLAGSDERSGVVLRVASTDGVHEVYVRVDGCRNLGFDDGVTRRKLTDECSAIFQSEPITFQGGQQEAADACWRDPALTTMGPEPMVTPEPTATPTDAVAPTDAVDPAEPVGAPFDSGRYADVADLVRHSDLIVTGTAGEPRQLKINSDTVNTTAFELDVDMVVAGDLDEGGTTIFVDVEGAYAPGADRALYFLQRVADGHFRLTGSDQGVFAADGEGFRSIEGGGDLVVDVTDPESWTSDLGRDRVVEPELTTLVDGVYYEDVRALVRNSDLVAVGRVVGYQETKEYPDLTSDDPKLNPYAGTGKSPSPEELEAMAHHRWSFEVEVTETLAGEAESPITVHVPVGSLNLLYLDDPLLFLLRAPDGSYHLNGHAQSVMVRQDDGLYVSIDQGRTDLVVDPTDTAWMAEQLGADLER